MTIRDSAASSAAYLDAHAYRNEAEFQASVVDLARTFGWWTYHVLRSKGSEPGFPDLLLLRPPRRIGAELKLEGGHLTADQVFVLELMAECGIEAYAWWPSSWDHLEEVLR